MILKLGMQLWGFKLYEVYLNDDPGLTLIYFMARSNFVVYVFIWGKLLQSLLMGTSFICLKNFDPKSLPAPVTGLSLHVYDHHFQASSLKLLGESKPKIYVEIDQS